MRTIPWVFLATALVACGSKGQGPKPEYLGRATGPGMEVPKTAPEPPQALLSDEAARSDLQTAIRLWQRRHELRQRIREDLAERAGKDPDLGPLNRQALEDRGFQGMFWSGQGPTRHLEALLEALREAPDHALPDRHSSEALESLIQQVGQAARQAEPLRAALEATPVFQAMKGLILAEAPPTAEEVEGLDQAGRLKGLGEAQRREALEAQQRWIEKEQELGRLANALEVEAQGALWRWALDMRFRVRASPFRAHRNDQEAVRKNGEAIRAFWERFAKDPRAALQGLVPAHPDYRALQAGLRRYREMAREGPFPTVSLPAGGSLKRGHRGPLVEALRARLAREGYLPQGSAGASFDAEVEEAVKAYQASHGFDPTGVLEDRHARSLNVPLDQRIRQIELGLQRWRESEVRPEEPLYVRVNLPEFMMAVYQGGRRVMHHRIVCGNNHWDVDPDSRTEGRINRTKIFTAAIERIIINPRWYVPGRIRKLELDYELLREPDYYRRRNFVVKTNPDGTEEVYQDSGDQNALGRVKFVFPNPYGIFMHDTNLKAFFRKEIRAFSHGCIRLQDPFEVMDLLLQEGAGISPDKGRAILAKGEMREIPLKTPVPIFIEYNSVGVDDRGQVQFYSDIYGYDKDYFDGKIPYSQEELNLLTRKITRFD
ncbi:L,D-transpeptidase family protein [Myxococcota bacterium]|nr:L,D-transpeptidase family protein [Myxococcota bacterium]